MVRPQWFIFLLPCLIWVSCKRTSQYTPAFSSDSLYTASMRQFAAILGDSTRFQPDSLPFRPDRPLSPGQASEDLVILCRIMDEVATARHRWQKPNELDTLMQRAYKQSFQSMTYMDLFREANRLVASMGDAHSSVGHSQAYKDWRMNFMEILPLKFSLHKGHELYIMEDFRPKPQIPPGTKVLAINRVPIRKVFRQIRPFISADGTQEEVRNAIIADYLPNAYPNFIEDPDSFMFQISTAEGPRYQTVGKLSRKQLQQQLGGRSTPSNPPLPLRYEYDPELESGLLDIDWFNKEYIQARGQDFPYFIDSVFADLEQRKAKSLIIDLRGNRGGWTEYGKILCSYLVSDTFPFVERVFTKSGGKIAFESLLTSEIPWQDTMQLQRDPDGFLNWENYPHREVIPASRHSFGGQVYGLIDYGTQSCAALVATTLNRYTKTTLAGTQTGGAGAGSGGMTLSFRLPHSGIGVTLSTAQYTYQSSTFKRGRGVVPKYIIYPHPMDAHYGHDAVMEKVKGLIRERLRTRKPPQ